MRQRRKTDEGSRNSSRSAQPLIRPSGTFSRKGRRGPAGRHAKLRRHEGWALSNVADPTVPIHGAPVERAPSELRSNLALRLRAGSEFVVIPVLAVIAALVIFCCFLLLIGKSPRHLPPAGLAWRLRHGLFVEQHAPARFAADPHRADGGDSGAARPHHHRRRGRAGARRLRGGRHRHPLRGQRRHGMDRDAGDDPVRRSRPAASGSASPAGSATSGASTRRSRRCCCPISPSRS